MAQFDSDYSGGEDASPHIFSYVSGCSIFLESSDGLSFGDTANVLVGGVRTTCWLDAKPNL